MSCNPFLSEKDMSQGEQMLTAEAITHLRTTGIKDKYTVEFNGFTLLLERHKTLLLFKKDKATMLIRELPVMHNGDTLNIDGDISGHVTVTIRNVED
jgi:hypothetical protein